MIETLRGDLQKVTHEADQTYQLYLGGGLTVEQFKERYQPLDTRKRQLEDEIPRAEAELDVLKIDEFSSEQIMAEARDLHTRWPKMNRDERRKIVEALVKDIVIGRGEITLNLCYLPSFEEMTNGQRILLHALPFCHLRIKALRRPFPDNWMPQTAPIEPKNLGEHIKQRRIELHLLQRDVAKRIGVHVESVKNWERGVMTPQIAQMPKIIEFLGYNPEAKPEKLSDWRPRRS